MGVSASCLTAGGCCSDSATTGCFSCSTVDDDGCGCSCCFGTSISTGCACDGEAHGTRMRNSFEKKPGFGVAWTPFGFGSARGGLSMAIIEGNKQKRFAERLAALRFLDTRVGCAERFACCHQPHCIYTLISLVIYLVNKCSPKRWPATTTECLRAVAGVEQPLTCLGDRLDVEQEERRWGPTMPTRREATTTRKREERLAERRGKGEGQTKLEKAICIG